MLWDRTKHGLSRAQDSNPELLDPIPDGHSIHGRPLTTASVPREGYQKAEKKESFPLSQECLEQLINTSGKMFRESGAVGVQSQVVILY